MDKDNKPNDSQPQQLQKPNWIIPATVLIILAAGVGALVYATRYKSPLPATTTTEGTPGRATTTASSPTASVSSSTTATPTPLVTDTGVTWLSAPQKLGDLKLFKPISDSDTFAGSQFTYFKMGTDNGSDIIYAAIQQIGPTDPDYAVFLKKDTTYALVTSQTTTYSDGKYFGPALVDGISTDTKTVYASLQNPAKLQVGGATLTATGTPRHLPFELIDPSYDGTTVGQKLGDTAYGTVYHNGQAGSSTPSTTELDLLYLKRQDSMLVNYQLVPSFINDAGVPQITWKDGTKNKDAYRYDGGGACGSASGVEVAAADISREITAVATANTGETIYAFSDTNNPIVTGYYDAYAIDYSKSTYDSNGNTTNKVYRSDAVSLADFNTKYHAVLVYKDALNRYVIFTNTTYGPQAECGKPVVYLYPTHTSHVDVKVEATVTRSEPTYNNGWDVTAQPNGTLTTSDGKTYDSLYWEGQGDGAYPVVNSGFVVAQSDLQKTIANQLRQLGLDAKESSDFMTFWVPRLPKTPYVRLTWFGTQQMNNLAPLHITPQPDTVIRIFLDARGLSQPISLPAQNLSSIPRKGFTVIEWGGLLTTR